MRFSAEDARRAQLEGQEVYWRHWSHLYSGIIQGEASNVGGDLKLNILGCKKAQVEGRTVPREKDNRVYQVSRSDLFLL